MRAIDTKFGVKSKLYSETDALSGQKSRDAEHRLGGIIFDLPIYVQCEKVPKDDEFAVKFFKVDLSGDDKYQYTTEGLSKPE